MIGGVPSVAGGPARRPPPPRSPRAPRSDPQRHELGAQLVQVAAGKAASSAISHSAAIDTTSRTSRRSATGRPAAIDDDPAPGAVVPPRTRRRTPGRPCRLGDEHRGEPVRRPPRRRGLRRDALELLDQTHRARIERRVRRRRSHASQLFAPLGPTYDRVGRRPLVRSGSPLAALPRLASARRDGGHVLDVATGTGLVAERLLDAGFTVTGLDQSPEMLADGPRGASGAASTLVEASAEALPFADAVVRPPHVHVPAPVRRRPGRDARELARVVRPGGTVAIARVRRAPRRLEAALGSLLRRRAARSAGASCLPSGGEVGRFLGPSIRDFYARCPRAAAARAVARRRHRRRPAAAA